MLEVGVIAQQIKVGFPGNEFREPPVHAQGAAEPRQGQLLLSRQRVIAGEVVEHDRRFLVRLVRQLHHLDGLIHAVDPLEPDQIKGIREKSRLSQAVFAALLNRRVSTVQKWEIGQKKPTGTARKLLHLVRKRGIEVVA